MSDLETLSPPAGEAALQAAFGRLRRHLNDAIIGQELLVERLLTGMVAGGHLLVEGAPGLAKTMAIKALANAVEASFHRIQFTPDLLPADLTGTEIYRPEEGSFHFQSGPLFHNLVLADEVNRAPAKVQSALLEAMGERQVTVGHETYRLPRLFMVMATQNPIEQEGTYPLPEAQLDRFMLHVRVDYPDAGAETQILRRVRAATAAGGEVADIGDFQPLPQEIVFAARAAAGALHLSEALERYLVHLVVASRRPADYAPDLVPFIRAGASPRGTIALDLAARARAWLDGRAYATPDDVQAVAPDVLRHRILLTFEAEADGVTADEVVDRLLGAVPLA
ncbi:MAG: AAA family ATPase [Sneathiellaceae bacterium]